METILFEVNNQIGWLTLNRPDKLNAFNEQMNKEIVQIIKQIEKDNEVRAVVIQGAGRAFCSGEDLSGIDSETDFGDVLRDRYNPMVKRLAYLEKPVIAAIDGAAAGAGLSLALACDFRIASDKASFLEAFIHVGLVPDSGNLYYLPRIIGYAKAMELAILGEKINADQAKELGLVTKVYSQDEFEQGVQAFAERLAKMPTKAVGLIKRYMQQSYETNLSQMLEYEAYAQATAGMTEDHKAGVQAFLNKQKPEFKGK
ncbi:enoyl-CoA hydratase-related protein [Scopulibacillus cellulosilyticus]|uniref:Enoyl-CoA hydratase-related protein n=1 Tax=Scopulibacillus cellulosilyticus TaxID=2665665 RepID=A0ABW2PQQ0_9BACL